MTEPTSELGGEAPPALTTGQLLLEEMRGLRQDLNTVSSDLVLLRNRYNHSRIINGVNAVAILLLVSFIFYYVQDTLNRRAENLHDKQDIACALVTQSGKLPGEDSGIDGLASKYDCARIDPATGNPTSSPSSTTSSTPVGHPQPTPGPGTVTRTIVVTGPNGTKTTKTVIVHVPGPTKTKTKTVTNHPVPAPLPTPLCSLTLHITC